MKPLELAQEAERERETFCSLQGSQSSRKRPSSILLECALSPLFEIFNSAPGTGAWLKKLDACLAVGGASFNATRDKRELSEQHNNQSPPASLICSRRLFCAIDSRRNIESLWGEKFLHFVGHFQCAQLKLNCFFVKQFELNYC